MDTAGRFKIDFRDLPDEGLTRQWELDDSFFSSLDEQEIQHGQLTATLRVKKKAGGFELELSADGTVDIPCDRCLYPMTQPISARDCIEVRMGQTLDDDGDRITIPEDNPVLDVAWNLYETIALAIPINHVHPDDGCPVDMSQYLVTSDEPAHDNSDELPSSTDSRWDALRSLLDPSKQ